MYKNEVKLDKSTFPADGQKVRYTVHPSLQEKVGYFDAKAELIAATPEGGDFTDMWHVDSWEPYEE